MAGNSKGGKSTPPHRPPPPNVIIPPARTTPPSIKKHFEQLQPLGISKVKWFYQEDKRWIPFNGADSLNIEKTYRSLPESLQSPLWIPNEIDHTGIELPTVRGSLYEIDILDRECRPIFWRENAVAIMRGTWFKGSLPGNWEPVEEKQALKIEEGHVQVVRSMGVGTVDNASSSVLQNVIHQIKIGTNRIEWHDISEVYIISESTGSRLAQKIGLSGATELHRGYDKKSEASDHPGDITHIVFLVHGMGQLYHAEGGIVHSRKKFAEAIGKANKRSFKHLNDHGRIEFFPIEWRSMLKLDEGIIGKITPQNLGSLRRVINDTTLDVFYYTSPFYREEIIQAMRHQLNSVYKQYCGHNPLFEEKGGKVSIIAHSLGSVIIHDVLTLWNSYLMDKDKNNADTQVAGGDRSYSWFWGWGRQRETDPQFDSSESNFTEDDLKKQLHEARLNVAKLEGQLSGANKNCVVKDEECYSLLFKVENVFNIGSPLGVFLVMRGIRPREDVEQHILPSSVCKRTYNIYDPADPVAYRLEPVIYDYYSNIPPIRLAHVGSMLEPSNQVASPRARGWFRSLFGSKSSSEEATMEYQAAETVDLPKSTSEKTEETLSGRRILQHRLDYVLESSMVEYFSAITSHQAYWHSLDFAKFVLQVAFHMDDDDVVITRVVEASQS